MPTQKTFHSPRTPRTSRPSAGSSASPAKPPAKRPAKASAKASAPDRTIPPPTAKLSQALRSFLKDEKPFHPVHKDEATLEEAETRLGAPIQPWWHAKDAVLPAAMRSFGCQEADYDNLTAGQFYTCQSKGPACRDGCVQHKKGHLPAFAYTHPKVTCARAEEIEGTTLLTRIYGGKFATCHACWMDGKRPPCDCAKAPLETHGDAEDILSPPPPSNRPSSPESQTQEHDTDLRGQQPDDIDDPDSIHNPNPSDSTNTAESHARKRSFEEEGEDELDMDEEEVIKPAPKKRRGTDAQRLSGALEKIPSPRSSHQLDAEQGKTLASSPHKTPRVDKGKGKAPLQGSATQKAPVPRGPVWQAANLPAQDSPLAGRSSNAPPLGPSLLPPHSPEASAADYEMRWRTHASEDISSQPQTPLRTPTSLVPARGSPAAAAHDLEGTAALSSGMSGSSAPPGSTSAFAQTSAQARQSSATPKNTSATTTTTSVLAKDTSATAEATSATRQNTSAHATPTSAPAPQSSAPPAKQSAMATETSRPAAQPTEASTSSAPAASTSAWPMLPPRGVYYVNTSEMYENLYQVLKNIRDAGAKQEVFMKNKLAKAFESFSTTFEQVRLAVEDDFAGLREHTDSVLKSVTSDRRDFARLDVQSRENIKKIEDNRRTIRMLEEQCSNAVLARDEAQASAAETVSAVRAELSAKEEERASLAMKLGDLTKLWHSAVAERKTAEGEAKQAWAKADGVVEEMRGQRNSALRRLTAAEEQRDAAVRRAEIAEAKLKAAEEAEKAQAAQTSAADATHGGPRLLRRYSF